MTERLTYDAQALEPGGWIDVLALDATGIGGDLLRFHGYTQVGSIWWQGNEYKPWPIKMEGFERTSAQPPVPKVTVANIDGSISAACLAFEDLLGALLIRHTTAVKYLDAANFAGGVNATADPTQEIVDTWKVERKAVEDNTAVQFELSSAINFAGKQLPGRQIVANVCGWLAIGGYRGPYCGYTGAPVAKADDTPTSDPTLDKCGGRVSSCKLRFGSDPTGLPFGSFPAAGMLRT
jgi:lambda family phage minor tail protein L